MHSIHINFVHSCRYGRSFVLPSMIVDLHFNVAFPKSNNLQMQIYIALRLQRCSFCYILVSFTNDITFSVETTIPSVWETRSQFSAMQAICYPFKYLCWHTPYPCLEFVIRHRATWRLIAMILWHLSVFGKIRKIIEPLVSRSHC